MVFANTKYQCAICGSTNIDWRLKMCKDCGNTDFEKTNPDAKGKHLGWSRR